MLNYDNRTDGDGEDGDFIKNKEETLKNLKMEKGEGEKMLDHYFISYMICANVEKIHFFLLF